MFVNKANFIPKWSSFCTSAKPEKAVKYTSTVLLPKTNFQQHLNAKLTIERDERIAKECGFSELYNWQRKHVKGKEFTLLDGPPYANGPVHIGHAINKILKDVIIRAQLLQGRRIHFVPGWDCHGLPIELKATSAVSKGERSAVEIRKQARKFVKSTIEEQMSAFRSWGVMADWDSTIYRTYDDKYVTTQLQTWWELYSRGLVYRDLKPVYWSPSSATALAEAELVYKDTHVSNAVILRLKVSNANFSTASVPIYACIWTTTPWTLPVNEAVCFSQDLQYSLVTFKELDGMYIIGSVCVESLSQKFQREATIVRTIEPSELTGLKYRHPWRREELRPLLPSSHVTSSGTGLVHAAPAHGHDDFLVGLKHGLFTTSLVDGKGRYTAQAGRDLAGLVALEEGSQVVLQKLSADIVHQENYTHSYPYDWRTDKPVIIRASQQWFIDTAQLKQPALDCLEIVTGSTDRLRSLLSSRPYWCVSRQRAWGVPIPVFYHRTSGRPLLSKLVVDRLCQHYSQGNADAWWTLPNDQLFPPEACRQLFVMPEDVVRGEDIMDIWLDSGLAWTGLEGRIADVCLEGGDQHTGWFQSSLLTSVAARDRAHTRHILTHGFVVDENGRKMSKSIGNVVDPQKVAKTAGVDALRWWVASHSHHTHVPASERLVLTSREQVIRLRGTLRFLLGALRDLRIEDTAQPATTYLDRYMLHVCRDVQQNVMKAYNSHAWNHVCTHIVNFATGPVSGLYVHVTKDRLYCDSESSPRRRSCRTVLATVLDTLTFCLAPVLPHLAEEVWLHHPLAPGKFWFNEEPSTIPDTWNLPAVEIIDRALAIKAEVDKQTVKSGTAKMDCILTLCPEDYTALKLLQSDEESWDSELTELLQVASVTLSEHSGSSTVLLHETTRRKCPRCRRFSAVEDGNLCVRCQQVLQ